MLLSDKDKLKESILRFASSELTSHAASFIGLSIILFSYLTFVADRFPAVPLSSTIVLTNKSTFDYMIIFSILLLLISGIVFALMRLVYYGHFVYRTINIVSRKESLKGLYLDISEEVEKKKILFVRVAWFKSGIATLSIGTVSSFVVGLFITLILFWAFFFV